MAAAPEPSAPANAAFVGSIPHHYHDCLGSLFFVPYARDLASRVPPASRRALELACGTGILTRAVADVLPASARLTATDLNEPMLAAARMRVDDPRIEWRQADATTLPFESGVFDLVVCQFGVMFFPDRVKAAAEVRRVLQPGAPYLFNAWGSLADNPVARVAQRVIEECFPDNPPGFYTVPWGYHDPDRIERDLRDAGFSDVRIEQVNLVGHSPQAAQAALGMTEGTPMAVAIRERGTVPIETVTERLSAAFAATFGNGPITVPLSAWVVRAS